MTIRSLALAACCLIAPAPAQAMTLPPAQVAFFGPDEFTVESFDLVKKALASYDALLAKPAPARETFLAANEVSNAALSTLQRGEFARQHPDWGTIGGRVDDITALVQHIRACGVTYHPALGVLSPAEIKLYEAIDKRADLRGSTPEEMASGLQRLAELAGNPAAKAMVEKYRRTEALGVLQASMPEFLSMVREDHVRLAKVDGPGAREDGQALERRVRALLALGAKGSTRLTITDDPLSPVEATLDTILATAGRRAAGRPADDPASKQARGVELKVDGDYAAVKRSFDYNYTKGKPKAQALVREHGYPTRVETGPKGTWLWRYGYARNGLDRVKTLTVSQKDGSLLDIEDRFGR